MILRRAYAFKHMLENMTLFIEDGQLLSGNVAGQPMATALYPEYSGACMPKEIDEWRLSFSIEGIFFRSNHFYMLF